MNTSDTNTQIMKIIESHEIMTPDQVQSSVVVFVGFFVVAQCGLHFDRATFPLATFILDNTENTFDIS